MRYRVPIIVMLNPREGGIFWSTASELNLVRKACLNFGGRCGKGLGSKRDIMKCSAPVALILLRF